LASNKSKKIVFKNLAADADLSSNSTDTSSREDSDESSTASDTSSNAGTDGKAKTENKNSATGVTALIAKLVNKADIVSLPLDSNTSQRASKAT
jgi:hypothetical protein